MASPAIGSPAPRFTLETHLGERFSLEAQRGRPVVIYVYPEDDSGGCTDENLEFSALAPAFGRLGAVLAGLSPDTAERHRRFVAKYDLAVTLLADPEREAIEGFGLYQMKKLYGREFMGVIRASILVDAEGRIAEMVRATRIKGHAAKMLGVLERHLAG